MDESTLRAESAARLRALAMPHPLTLESLCAAVAALMHRPRIRIESASLGGDYGAWIARAGEDVLVHEAAALPFQRVAIVCHELAHILWEHRPVAHLDGEGLQMDSSLQDLFEVMDVRELLLLKRSTYTAREDREAEVLGRMLYSRLLREQATTGGDGALGRYASSIRGRETEG